MSAALRLPIEITKRSIYSGRAGKHVHDAKLGRLECSAPTAKEATEHLALTVASLVDDITAPFVLWGNDGSVWMTYRDAYGWANTIHRPEGAKLCPIGNAGQGGTSGGFASRREAIDALRSHWYQVNVEPIILGLVALCSDWRQWNCDACCYSSTSRAPYVCKSPACGKVLS